MSRILFVSFLLMMVLGFQSAWPKEAIQVIPQTITSTQKGYLNVEVQLTEPGSTVVLALTVDSNGNGIADEGEFDFFRFTVQDGFVPDLPHDALVYDRDGAVDGWINVLIPCFDAPHPVGKFVLQARQESQVLATPFTVNPEENWNQSVSGQVVKNGEGIAALVLCMWEGDQTDFEVMVLTDENGNFTARVPFAGPWVLGPVTFDAITYFDPRSLAFVDLLEEEQKVLDAPLTVYDGPLTVQGFLLAWDGEGYTVPVPNVMVNLEAEIEDEPHGKTQQEGGFLSISYTDENGAFSLHADQGWAELIIARQNSSGLVARSHWLNLESDDITNLLVKADRYSSVLKGRVVNLTDGSTIHHGLELEASQYDYEHGESIIEDIYTDHNGEFSIGVSGGYWWLGIPWEQVEARGFYFLTPNYVSVFVESEETVQLSDFIIGEPTTTITALVRDAGTQAPLRDVGVRLMNENGEFMDYRMTQMNGSATFPVLEGSYLMNLDQHSDRLAGYVPILDREVSVEWGNNETVLFNLEPSSATATITVKNAQGNPIPGVYLVVDLVQDQQRQWLSAKYSDEFGQATFSLSEGDYMAWIGYYPGYPDYYLHVDREFSLQEGEQAEITLILYTRDATLTVRVEDQFGNPFPGAPIILIDPSHGGVIAMQYTGNDGKIHVEVPNIPLVVGLDPEYPLYGHQFPANVQVSPPYGSDPDLVFIIRQSEPGINADINGDGIVDGRDLLLLIRAMRR